MKRLLLAPLLLMLTSCGYGSAYEARNACNELARQKEKENLYDSNSSTKLFDCEEDVQTRQYLIIEYDVTSKTNTVRAMVNSITWVTAFSSL